MIDDIDDTPRVKADGITSASMFQLHGNQAGMHVITMFAMVLGVVANQASASVIQMTLVLRHVHSCISKGESVHGGQCGLHRRDYRMSAPDDLGQEGPEEPVGDDLVEAHVGAECPAMYS
ncbi:hypothetical protein ABBQ38_014200 [Trebouxia sp. C0009 RCD-2024]